MCATSARTFQRNQHVQKSAALEPILVARGHADVRAAANGRTPNLSQISKLGQPSPKLVLRYVCRAVVANHDRASG